MFGILDKKAVNYSSSSAPFLTMVMAKVENTLSDCHHFLHISGLSAHGILGPPHAQKSFEKLSRREQLFSTWNI
jgi:hypothetical protein